MDHSLLPDGLATKKTEEDPEDTIWNKVVLMLWPLLSFDHKKSNTIMGLITSVLKRT